MIPLKSFQLTQHGGASAKIHSVISSPPSSPCVNRDVGLSASLLADDSSYNNPPSLSSPLGEVRKLDTPNVLLSSRFSFRHRLLNCLYFIFNISYDIIIALSIAFAVFTVVNTIFLNNFVLENPAPYDYVALIFLLSLPACILHSLKFGFTPIVCYCYLIVLFTFIVESGYKNCDTLLYLFILYFRFGNCKKNIRRAHVQNFSVRPYYDKLIYSLSVILNSLYDCIVEVYHIVINPIFVWNFLLYFGLWLGLATIYDMTLKVGFHPIVIPNSFMVTMFPFAFYSLFSPWPCHKFIYGWFIGYYCVWLGVESHIILLSTAFLTLMHVVYVNYGEIDAQFALHARERRDVYLKVTPRRLQFESHAFEVPNFSGIYTPEIKDVLDSMHPKIGLLAQNFSLAFVGVCSSTNNTATTVIVLQYFQTLTDKPLYLHVKDSMSSILDKMCNSGFVSHSAEDNSKRNNVSDYFKLLYSNFGKAQMATEYFGDVCNLLTFTMTTGLVDKLGPKMDASKMAAIIKFIKPKQISSKSPVELLLNTINGILVYASSLFGIDINPVSDDHELQYVNAISISTALAAGTFNQNYPNMSRQDIVPTITTIIRKYEKLVLESTNPMEKAMYSSKLVKLQAAKQKCANIVKTDSFVEAAYSLVLFGPTSVGKSHLTDIIGHAIGAKHGFPTRPENIAVIVPGDEYDTGVTADTTWCNFDDVGFLKDFSKNKHAEHSIRYINNVPTLAVKADLAEKGMVHICPRLCIATTNTKFMQIPNIATVPIAVLRRSEIITVEGLPEYTTHDMLDPDKLPDLPMHLTDAWKFKIERVVPSKAQGGYECVVIAENIRIGELLQIINERAGKHYARQRKIVAQKYANASVQLCPCGSMIGLCRKCDGSVLESHSFNFDSCVSTISDNLPKVSDFKYRFLDMCFKKPAFRLFANLLINHFGGKTKVFDSANVILLFLILIGFSFVYINEFVAGFCVISSSAILRIILSNLVNSIKQYYTIIDFYSDSVNYVSIKTGIDSSRIRSGLRYCTYGAAALLAVKIYKSYCSIKLLAQSSDHPEVKVVDEIKYHPWLEADRLARLPRDPSTLGVSNPSVKLDQLAKFRRILLFNRCVLMIYKERDYSGVEQSGSSCGIRIDRKHILVNTHAIKGAYSIMVSGSKTRYMLNDSNVMHFGDDLSLIYWTLGGAVADLTNYFVDDMPPLNTPITVHFPDGPISTYLIGNRSVETGKASFKDGLVYKSDSSPGKCGSIVTCSSRCEIIGLHAAGSQDGTSAAVSISKSLIKSMVDKMTKSLGLIAKVKEYPEGTKFMSHDGDLSISMDFPAKSIVNYTELGDSVKVYGYFPLGHPLAARSGPSALVELASNDIVSRHYGMPNKYIPKMDGINGLYNCQAIVQDWNDRPVGFSVGEYAMAAEEMLSTYIGLDLSSLRPVSTAESINGKPTAKYCPPINVNTSGGYPFPGTKIKHLYNVPEEDGRNNFHMTSECREKYDDLHESLRGDLPFKIPLFTTSLKDEARKLKKWQRPINTVSMILVFIFRKYFMMLSRFDSIHSSRTGVAIGTNPYGPDFEEIYDELFYDGAGIIAGDFSKYDSTISVDALLAVYGVMYQLFVMSGNYDSADLNVVTYLITMSVSWFTVIAGVLVCVAGANSSGHPLTTLVNCRVNELFMICAFNRLRPDQSIKFTRVMKRRYYGDDNLISVPPDCQGFFNQLTLTDTFASVGIKYTDANKKESVEKFCDHSEASFLKRKFYRHEDLNCVIGALELEAIFDSLRYASKSSIVQPRSEESHIAELLDNAVMELFYHGKDVYSKHYAILDSIAVELGIQNLVRYRDISYEDRVLAWKKDYGR